MLHPTDLLALQRMAPILCGIDDRHLRAAIDSGRLLANPDLTRGAEAELAAFYAPFDWINDGADIVILGITPGKQQAEAALRALRRELLAGASIEGAAARAKQEASFKGEMREIAALLMDHFELNRLFKVSSCSMLFDEATARVHYTSVFRHPVLELKNGMWKNYSGASWRRYALLQNMIETHLIPELQRLPNAWLVPFGPVPSEVLDRLGRRGLIDNSRILSGLNHPSGQQWNRHNCQLDRVDHSRCAPNVGCQSIRARSAGLRSRVREALASG